MKFLAGILFILYCVPSFGKTVNDKTICLNMIVKNESKVIKRCLSSLKHIIDYWVIVDTGSTDGTQGIIKEFMKDKPGELHERKWKNFAHNRNEALELAKKKADYILFIDADEEFVFSNDFALPKLDKDTYLIKARFEDYSFYRTALVKGSSECKWEGVLHEIIKSKEEASCDFLIGIENIVRREGCRSQDPGIYLKDAAIFEAEIKKNPKDSRSVYYLAQSYCNARNFDKAIKYYNKRATMTEPDEEVFLSYLTIALINKIEKNNPELFIQNCYKAYSCRTNRAEPLYFLARHYRENKKYHESFTISSFGLRIPSTTDLLAVKEWIYDYGLLYEFAICAYEIGRYIDAYLALLKLNDIKNIVPYSLDRVKNIINAIENKASAGEIKGIRPAPQVSGDIGK